MTYIRELQKTARVTLMICCTMICACFHCIKRKFSKRLKWEGGINSLSCQPRLSPKWGPSRDREATLFPGYQTHSQHYGFLSVKFAFYTHTHTQSSKLFSKSNQTFISDHPFTSSENLLLQRKEVYLTTLYLQTPPSGHDSRAQRDPQGWKTH